MGCAVQAAAAAASASVWLGVGCRPGAPSSPACSRAHSTGVCIADTYSRKLVFHVSWRSCGRYSGGLRCAGDTAAAAEQQQLQQVCGGGFSCGPGAQISVQRAVARIVQV